MPSHIDEAVPERLRDVVSRQLDPTERLVWVEQSEPGDSDPWWKLVPKAAFLLLFAGTCTIISGGGFVAAVLGKLRTESGEVVPVEEGVPIALILLGVSAYMLARFVWVIFWPRGPDDDPIYAFTNRRVFVVKPDWFRRVKWKEAPLFGLEMKVTRRSQGIGGEIRLSHAKALRVDDDRDFMKLERLRDVRKTEAVLQRLIQSNSKSSL